MTSAVSSHKNRIKIKTMNQKERLSLELHFQLDFVLRSQNLKKRIVQFKKKGYVTINSRLAPVGFITQHRV